MLIRLFAFLCGCVSVFAAGEKSSLAIDLGHSRVEILVKATMDSFTGRLEKFTPSVSLDDLGRVVDAQVHFEFADIKTGKEKRDRAMNEWQQTEKFPDGEFALISLSPGTTDKATVQGRLTFHGVTRSVEFPVSVVSDHSLYSIDGQVEIDTRNFGLPIIRMIGGVESGSARQRSLSPSRREREVDMGVIPGPPDSDLVGILREYAPLAVGMENHLGVAIQQTVSNPGKILPGFHLVSDADG